jgi:hypothetical protein
MEVWCGIIVGFDNDDPSIFAAQHRFIREARIVHAMVNMLVAIPRTPLYTRLATEGRLDRSDDAALWGGFGTNVIPRRISREALRAGYVELMHDLYVLDAYFGRLGNLYLDTRLQMGQARARYLQRHPLRRFKLHARLLAEAAAIFLLLRDLSSLSGTAVFRDFPR